MAEQHFSEIAEDSFSASRIGNGYRRIFQGQTLRRRTERIVRFESHKRGKKRRYGMSDRFREPVAVACRAGPGIGDAAGTEDHCVEAVKAPFPTAHAADSAVPVPDKRRDALVQKPAAAPFAVFHKRMHDVGGSVGDGKHPPSAFRFQRNAQRLKKRHRVGRRKAVDRGIEKLPVCRHVFYQFLGRTVVGKVAPALSGDAELFAGSGVSFKDGDLAAKRRCASCRRESRRAAADNGDLSFVCHDGPRFPERKASASSIS